MNPDLADTDLANTDLAQDTEVGAGAAAEADAVRAVVAHHAELAGGLSANVESLLAAVGAIAGTGEAGVEQARDRLVAFCLGELLPHAAAEEGSLYPAAIADPRARLLVEAMVAEHRVLEALVGQVRTVKGPVRVAGSAYALRVMFEAHLAKENHVLLPLLAADPELSLASILTGMRELLGHDEREGSDAGRRQSPAVGGCGGACGCGSGGCGDGQTDAGPVLDVREVPHAIRQATVLGAVGAVPPGGSLVLIAPHDPLPLLAQVDDREPGAFEVAYEVQGPQSWRLRLTRSSR
jgi:uncharacterized protein (DUF2249 family)